jgi:hypothetical protein
MVPPAMVPPAGFEPATPAFAANDSHWLLVDMSNPWVAIDYAANSHQTLPLIPGNCGS